MRNGWRGCRVGVKLRDATRETAAALERSRDQMKEKESGSAIAKTRSLSVRSFKPCEAGFHRGEISSTGGGFHPSKTDLTVPHCAAVGTSAGYSSFIYPSSSTPHTAAKVLGIWIFSTVVLWNTDASLPNANTGTLALV